MNQLADALEKAGYSPEDVTALRSSPALLMKLRRELCEEFAKGRKGILLSLCNTITLPAITRFVTSDHYKVDISETVVVKIGSIGEDFRMNFLGKVEENIPEIRLRTATLEKESFNPDIIAELGNRHEISLAHHFSLLQKQGKGEKGGSSHERMYQHRIRS
jgi:hypothetical protein